MGMNYPAVANQTAASAPSSEVKTVVEYKTNTVTKDVVREVKVNVFPQACLDAQRYAVMIQDDVSAVATVMGTQMDIATMGRMAINGSSYIDLGQVQLRQSNLEGSLVGIYTHLAEVEGSLSDATKACDKAIASN